jgi:hypothetical protein
MALLLDLQIHTLCKVHREDKTDGRGVESNRVSFWTPVFQTGAFNPTPLSCTVILRTNLIYSYFLGFCKDSR